jgi:hypothetical protein
MKKFLVRIIVFFVAVAIIDILFGMCCDYMYENSKSGDSRKINYAIIECNADILIMGSSRANHHYNPQILSDSLGLSCYNLGIDGSGAILMDGFYRLITQRYVPKLIIYELTPSFDFYQNPVDANNTRYLAQLKPYYSEGCLKQLFDDVEKRERFKLNSGLYRYNTSCLNLFRSFIGHGTTDNNGYLPLKGVMTKHKPFSVSTNNMIDSLKIQYLKQLISDCKKRGTQLLFVVSPRYGATTSIEYNLGFDICKESGFDVLDFFCSPNFIATKEFFYDSYHLNDIGAAELSKALVKEIKYRKIVE